MARLLLSYFKYLQVLASSRIILTHKNLLLAKVVSSKLATQSHIPTIVLNSGA